MRIRHSFKKFVPFLLMLAAGRNAAGQQGAPPSSVPAGYLPAYGSPYTGGTPYDPMFEQTYNDNGTWFSDQRSGFGAFNKPRKFFLNMDYTNTKTRKLHGIFGSPTAQSYYQQNDPDSDGIITGLSFYRYMDAGSGTLIPDLTNHGLRSSGGFWNVDGTGLLLDFGWQVDDSATYDARGELTAGRMDTATALALNSNGGRAIVKPFRTNGQTDYGITVGQILAPGTPFDDQDANDYGAFGSTFDVLDRTLLNLNSVPIDDGSLLGASIPYDLQFLMKHSLSALGSSGAIAFAPVYEHGGIRVNPIVGGRYQKIKEQFSFLGVDSGLAYVGGGDDDTPDNAKVFPDYNGVDNNNDFFIDNLAEDGTPDFTQINSFDPVLVTATHMAQVTSNLAGPDFGFHYTLGDDKGIALVGSSRLAAMFNNEQITIRGDNLYNHMAVSATPDPVTGLFPPTDGFDTNNLNGPSANAYGGSYSTVHLSPLFEQTLTAEIPIFSRVPVLSNMKLLEDAKFRLGYTFLCVGEVADPLQSVIYTSNPQLNLFPSIKPDRHSFTQHTISVGVNWNY